MVSDVAAPARTKILLAGGGGPGVRATLEHLPDLDLLVQGEGAAANSVALVVYAPDGATPIEDELAAIREHTSAPVILVADAEQHRVLDQALGANLADVLVLPQSAEGLGFAIRKTLRGVGGQVPRGHARLITVFSPKGGTGKTVIATNIASYLSRRGHRTLLIDLDLQFGDAAIMLGVTPRRTLHDLMAVSSQLDAEKLVQFVSTAANTGSTPQNDLALLPAPQRPEEGERISEKQAAHLIEVALGAYEIVVVDTAPLFDGAMLAALERSDDLLLVCGPDVPAVKNVRLGLQTLDQLSFPDERVSVIHNRAGAKGGLSTAEIEGALMHPIRYTLPEDPAVAQSVNRSTPVVLMNERAPFARAIATMGEALAAVESRPARSHRRLFGGRRA